MKLEGQGQESEFAVREGDKSWDSYHGVARTENNWYRNADPNSKLNE